MVSTPLPDKDYENTVKGQFDAATPSRSAWVSANAGSGKTKVLIDRVARLLLGGVKPDAILCVTYTKAAASEMQGRLFKRLGGWCVSTDAALRKELAELERRDIKTYTDDDLGKARELFAIALETPGGLRIETIHAFCGRMLRRFPLEAGAPPGFRELDDTQAEKLWHDAISKLGLASEENSLIREAVDIAALAAGGNGLTAPLRSLLSKQAAIETFLTRHGGVQGASEMMRHTLSAPSDPSETLLEDFFSNLPVPRIRNLISPLFEGAKSDVSLATDLETVMMDGPLDQRWKVYRSLAFTGSDTLRKKDPYTKDLGEALPDLVDLFQIKEIPEGEEIYRIKQLDEALRTRRLFERSAALLHLAEKVFSHYADAKRRRAALDFDDLINIAANLLTQKAAAQWVLWKLDGGLTHVLLDEAQDTSPEQWQLINALTQEFYSGQGVERENPRTMFVVGDEKQSIYSFQGADPERFLTERRYFEDKVRSIGETDPQPNIEMSFRSAPEILSFVDTVFDTDMFDGDAPFSVTPPAEADTVRHLPFRRDQAGSVELWALEPPPQRDEATPWDAPRGQETETSPKARLASNIAKWARGVIDRRETVWEDGKQRAANAGDILILVRGRKGGLFDAIIKALKREAIPVAGADRIDLLDSLPVQDLLNFLRFVLCPEDDLTLAEILTGPFGGLNENDHLFDLAFNRKESLWCRVQQSNHPQVQEIADLLSACLERRHWPAYEFLTALLEGEATDDENNTKGGWDLLQARMGTPVREPVIALLDRANAFDQRGAASLQLFLNMIETQGGEVKRELSEQQGEVRVMTVHGSKGLEAPIVILPDMCSAPQTKLDDGLLTTPENAANAAIYGMPLWPGAAKQDTSFSAQMRSYFEARAVREHRRLLYVALTRAQDRLLICGPWTGGENTKTGFKAGSWYAACLAAMEKLAETGKAERIENDQQSGFRYGKTPRPGKDDKQKRDDKLDAPDWLWRKAESEDPAFHYAAPSTLIANEPTVLAPFGKSRAARLARGRLIHTLLQTLPDTPRSQWRARAADWLSKDTQFTALEHAGMIDDALGVLDNPEFEPIFTPEGRAEAPIVGGNEHELPKGMRINGRVDRLVVTQDYVLIIDFKTDRPAPARVEDVGQVYTTQMAAYRAVLMAAYPDRPVRCAIVWTDGPRMMELISTHMDQALQELRDASAGITVV